MPQYPPLSQAELVNAITTRSNQLVSARNDLAWFYLTGFNTGLRGAEIVNLPKLILDETATQFLVQTYKGSGTRLLNKTSINGELRTACEERNFNWTLWSQRSFAHLILNMNQSIDLWYVDTSVDLLTSRLLTHQYRIRLINFWDSTGVSHALIANRMGINVATVEHYLSMRFFNSAA